MQTFCVQSGESLGFIWQRYRVQILIVGALLLIFGLSAIYSVSIFESFDLTLDLIDKWLMTEPSNYYFFFEQVVKLCVWLVLAGIVYWMPMRRIIASKYVIFALTLGGVFLLFTSMGIELNGSNAWLSVPGGTIQPGEFFKVGFVMYIASWLVKKQRVLDDFQFFMGFLIITGVIYSIFLFVPDLWTILVLFTVAMIMFRYAWGKKRFIAALFWAALFAAVIAASQFTYINKRVTYFFNPDADSSWRGIGWQTKQALIAVGGGGRIGKGYGKWLQKFGYIPEAQSDFIFAAFAEEVGFLGSSALVFLYLLLCWYFLRALPDIKDPYQRLIGVWFVSMIMMQMCINVWVNIKLVPLTWLTLPFVSHGGSALIVNMIEVVLLYKIVKQNW
jgi:cell division protein FtsW (lipid II flippase)